jgi:SAM-dependent methyltransferase
MNLNRVLRWADFAEIASDIEEIHTGNPFAGRPVYRKAWEVAMSLRALRGGGQRALGIGAGIEITNFYLTNFFEEVHATDMYAEPGTWHLHAPPAMLTKPETCVPAGYPWRPERLIVQHMDARHLRYPDQHFDAVFSAGSIEHFGTLDEIAQSAREIGRVLKPGGIASISTEFKLNTKRGIGWNGVVVFDRDLLYETVIKPSGLHLVDEPQFESDAETYALVRPLRDYVEAFHAGKIYPHPDVVLEHDGYVYTSIHIALRKAT